MKIEGGEIQYWLSRNFPEVECNNAALSVPADYPVLYDDEVTMSGHIVVVPAGEIPKMGQQTKDCLFVCLDDESKQAVVDAGAPAVWIDSHPKFSDVFNCLQRVFISGERLDVRLRTLVDAHASFKMFLDAAMRPLSGSCLLIDSQFRIICRSSSAYAGDGDSRNADGEPSNRIGEYLESEVVDLLMASHDYHRMRMTRNVFTAPGLQNLFMKNIFEAGKLVGTLIMRHSGDFYNAMHIRRVLNYLGPCIEEMYLHHGTFGQSTDESAQIHIAFKKVLDGDSYDHVTLDRLLLEDGNAEGSSYVVMSIVRSFTNEGKDNQDYLMRRLENAWPSSYCVSSKDGIFILANTGNMQQGGDDAFWRSIMVVARENLIKVGISRPIKSTRRLRAARMQAMAALEQGDLDAPDLWYYRFDDYALAWITRNGVGQYPANYVCHAAVLSLLRHDAQHGTELLHTLNTFMDCRYNATAAADRLFVARSTLLNRLERIQEMTGIDLDSLDERAYISLSFNIIEER